MILVFTRLTVRLIGMAGYPAHQGQVIQAALQFGVSAFAECVFDIQLLAWFGATATTDTAVAILNNKERSGYSFFPDLIGQFLV